MMTIIRSAALALLPLVSLLAVPAAAAPEAPYEAVLDQSYAARDYDGLARQLFDAGDSDRFMTSLDWLGGKFRSDGSSFISYAYARMLLAVAANMQGDEATDIRTTALTALTQAVVSAQIDALQCEDTTALGIKARELAGELQASGLRDLPLAQREMAAAVVMVIEQNTWPVRQQADHTAYLCTGGMAAMIAGLDSGTQRDVPPQDGQAGRQVEVTPPAGFVHRRRADQDWIKDAEQLRSERGEIVKFLLAVERVPALSELSR